VRYCKGIERVNLHADNEYFALIFPTPYQHETGQSITIPPLTCSVSPVM